MVIGGTWSVLWWTSPDGLAVQAMKAWGALLVGAFLILALGRRRPAGQAALWAAVAASIAFVPLLGRFGLDFRTLELATARDMWDSYRAVLDGTAGLWSPAIRSRVMAMADTVGGLAQLAPAGCFLGGALGLSFAWRWYHRIATGPIGAPLPPFEAFRFSDHLVWVLVAALGAVLAQAGGFLLPGSGPANVLLVMGTLYLLRGLAVAWPVIRSIPFVERLALTLILVLLALFSLSALFGLGLADTWIDFRRRRAARAQGG
ncbi:MAG: DUF2232 domain-containing protein [Gemmatimonadales bacterium]